MEKKKLSHYLYRINRGKLSFPSFQACLLTLLERGKGKHFLEELLQAKANISSRNYDKSVRTRMDITKKHIVQLLLNSAENCSLYAKRKQTVMHSASKYGWLEVVRSLLKRGADPNVKDYYGETPLLLATLSLHKDVVQLLIQSGADVLCRSIVNYTLLHAASEKGWLEFVRSLLSNGFNPNVATQRGFTPLDFAIRESHKNVVSLLIEAGADVDHCKLQLGKILHYAVRLGDVRVLKLALKKTCTQFSFLMSILFYIACSYHQAETIEYLVTVLNIINDRDNPPLNCVIAKTPPDFRLVRRFIERGAYFDVYCYHMSLMYVSLKVGILKDAHICTQAIINKFNCKDLPDLYKLPLPIGVLPPMKHLILRSPAVMKEIKESVKSEIETKGYCNMMKPKGIVLSMMAVKSYLDYYEGKKKSRLKKRAAIDSGDHSYSRRKFQFAGSIPIDLRLYDLESVERFLYQW